MKKLNSISLILFLTILLSSLSFSQKTESNKKDGNWLFLKDNDIAKDVHNLDHYKNYSKYAKGYNLDVLKAVDSVQAHAMDGGGYFIGIHAKPTESPVGYNLKLFGNSLINPPRTTSYCSGSSYTALVEALNMIYPNGDKKLSKDRLEALRMQEPDGGRRNDWVKFWGIWNADGFGSDFALVQYGKMGKVIKPENARPGDFMNISWKSGIGHSVVFLGWYIDKDGTKNAVYWSSQTGTNGYGDQVTPISKIKNVKIVRLTNPGNVFKFNVAQKINKDIPGDELTF